ncbi:MAG: glycosyl hydrolase family 65 protein [Flavobacteriaceae bacterium]
MELKNNLSTRSGWEIIENSFNEEQLVTTGSNFMIGNGYMGYRGTFEEWTADRFVACIVTDTWDQAEGSRWSELCNVPNGLFTQLFSNGMMISAFDGEIEDYYRALDMKHGLNQRKFLWSAEGSVPTILEVEKFASMNNPHLLVMRYSFTARDDGRFTLRTGIDGKVWSINGEHFRSADSQQEKGCLLMELHTSELNTKLIVAEGIILKGPDPVEDSIVEEDNCCLREYVFELEKNQEVVMEKVVSITHDNELEDPRATALDEVLEGLEKGYNNLKADHTSHWDNFWDISDIQIGDNTEAQIIARFNIYQAYIATPTHANLPVGARGLSCQVYQGAAFWDQETFNLPMFVYTHPNIANKLVSYRHDTLDGARRKANDLGYYGAFYAWTSGKTGDELFPDYFFTDVLTGRPIRNHFNCWQIHISPDVVYGIWLYFEATQDWDFMLKYGAEVLFEVAQFLVSRVHFKKDKNRYELIRVLGPDEYHENVDNNAYTNYLSKFSLEKAAWIYGQLKLNEPETLSRLIDITGITPQSVDEWNEIAELLFMPLPDQKTHLIEQFDGYFKLEDIRPDELRKRLIDPEEYWGWPNGIAIATQVLKQADVIQLLALTDNFPEEVLQANYEYYEPRTEHGSSLSPSVHALVACKANHQEEAYRYFIEGSTIDLYNASKKVMSGGSFLGGIHTAAAGGVWLIIIQGFAGFALSGNGIRFKPALPESWRDLSFKLRIKECLIVVEISKNHIRVQSDPANKKEIEIDLGGVSKHLNPGEEISSVY